MFLIFSTGEEPGADAHQAERKHSREHHVQGRGRVPGARAGHPQWTVSSFLIFKR